MIVITIVAIGTGGNKNESYDISTNESEEVKQI